MPLVKWGMWGVIFWWWVIRTEIFRRMSSKKIKARLRLKRCDGAAVSGIIFAKCSLHFLEKHARFDFHTSPENNGAIGDLTLREWLAAQDKIPILYL